MRIDDPASEVEVDRELAVRMQVTPPDVMTNLVAATNRTINFEPIFFFAPSSLSAPMLFFARDLSLIKAREAVKKSDSHVTVLHDAQHITSRSFILWQAQTSR